MNSKLYYKRDDFDFPIVNLTFLSSNIPALPAYGVYIAQLICYARACVQNGDFLERGQWLSQKLLSQGYIKPRLESSFHKFYGRRHKLVDHYLISVSQMTKYMFA